MTARVVPLASAEAGEAPAGGTFDSRLAAVHELAVELWRLSGRPLPSYSRATIPITVATLADHLPSL